VVLSFLLLLSLIQFVNLLLCKVGLQELVEGGRVLRHSGRLGRYPLEPEVVKK